MEEKQSIKVNMLDKPLLTWCLSILIVFSVVCFTLETIPGLDKKTTKFLYYAELLVVSIFTLEYIYRVYTSTNKLKYIFSFYGLIDLIAILPFYINFIVDLRALRLLRLFRLFRILKILRYSQALRRFNRAIYLAKEELIIFLSASLVMLYLSAVGIYYFENKVQPENFRSILDCLWWSVATITTVGYGDIYPVTVGGKIFTFFVLFIGIGLVAVPTGIFSSALLTIKNNPIQNP